MKKYLKWIIFAILVVVFAGITYCVVSGKSAGFDESVYKAITKVSNPALDNTFKFITFFGSTIGIIVLCVATLIFMKNKKHALWIIGGTGGVTILNNIIKFSVRRARPAEPVFRKLVEEKSYSFPSGHTMGSIGFYGMIMFFIIRSNLNKKMKIIYSSLLTILMIAIMVSRLYLAAHFATDVLAGAVAAVAFLIVFTHFKKSA